MITRCEMTAVCSSPKETSVTRIRGFAGSSCNRDFFKDDVENESSWDFEKHNLWISSSS